jgi:hypothetical protein
MTRTADNLKSAILPSQLQAIGEQARQACLNDLPLRSRQVVLYPPLFDHIFLDVINAISGAPIAIPRLSDAANVNEVFFRFLDCELIDLHFLYAVVAHKCSCYVRVPEEANGRVLIGETRDGIEAIEDVAPLVRRIECRMDDREIANLPR